MGGAAALHHLFHLRGIWRAEVHYSALQSPVRAEEERGESSDMVWFELVTRSLLRDGVSTILTIHKAEKYAEREGRGGGREWKKNSPSKFPAASFFFYPHLSSLSFSSYSASFFSALFFNNASFFCLAHELKKSVVPSSTGILIESCTAQTY